MSKETALKLRKQLKAKKPTFLREDYQKRACLNPVRWRRPRGIHSKMRHRFAGHRALVTPGYGSPKEAFGLHPSGLAPVVVHTLNELSKLNAKTHGAVLGSTLGLPKRMLLLAKAKELGLRVLSVKNIDAALKEIKDGIASRKENKASTLKAKETKAKAKEQAAAKKPALAEKVNDEEQKKKEAQEKNKELITRQ